MRGVALTGSIGKGTHCRSRKVLSLRVRRCSVLREKSTLYAGFVFLPPPKLTPEAKRLQQRGHGTREYLREKRGSCFFVWSVGKESGCAARDTIPATFIFRWNFVVTSFEFGTGALSLVMSQAFPLLLATVCELPATGVGRGERGGDRRQSVSSLFSQVINSRSHTFQPKTNQKKSRER